MADVSIADGFARYITMIEQSIFVGLTDANNVKLKTKNKIMDHSQFCPINMAENGTWYTTSKPYCNCAKISDSNPDNFQKVLNPAHPYNCEHIWRDDKTAVGMIVCNICGQMENINQEKQIETLKAAVAETGCNHKFVFSHQSQEARGIGTTYQMVYYSLCERCGLIKSQSAL